MTYHTIWLCMSANRELDYHWGGYKIPSTTPRSIAYIPLLLPQTRIRQLPSYTDNKMSLADDWQKKLVGKKYVENEAESTGGDVCPPQSIYSHHFIHTPCWFSVAIDLETFLITTGRHSHQPISPSRVASLGKMIWWLWNMFRIGSSLSFPDFFYSWRTGYSKYGIKLTDLYFLRLNVHLDDNSVCNRVSLG